MKRESCVWLLMAVALTGARVAAAEVAPVEAAGDATALPAMQELDVVGNVRHMLEASRTHERADTAATAADEAAPADPHESGVTTTGKVLAPVLSQPAQQDAGIEITPVPPVSPPRQAASPTPPAGAASKPVARTASDHVPLPEKEITIRSLEDLRILSQELESAKAEKAQR